MRIKPSATTVETQNLLNQADFIPNRSCAEQIFNLKLILNIISLKNEPIRCINYPKIYQDLTGNRRECWFTNFIRKNDIRD